MKNQVYNSLRCKPPLSNSLQSAPRSFLIPVIEVTGNDDAHSQDDENRNENIGRVI
jgi:hypothetical protein